MVWSHFSNHSWLGTASEGERESWVAPQKKRRARSCGGGASNAGEAVQAPEGMLTVAHCLSAHCKNGSAVARFHWPPKPGSPPNTEKMVPPKEEQWGMVADSDEMGQRSSSSSSALCGVLRPCHPYRLWLDIWRHTPVQVPLRLSASL